MPVGDILPEIALILGAVACLLTASFLPQRRHGVCAVLAAVAILISAGLCIEQLGMPERLTFSGVWALDLGSTWGRLLILGATLITVPLTPGWFATDRRHGEYYALLLFGALGAMALTGAADLLQLMMGVLLSSVTGYTLAAYHRDWPASLEAGMKFFLIGALANTLLVIGIILVYGLLGETGYRELAAVLAVADRSILLLLGIGFLIIGLAFKLGAAPAHAWMPDVAEGAPVPAAAFLTVVPKIGAAIALARLVELFPPDAGEVRLTVALIAAATMTIGNLAALWQDDLRRMLGWSSVSQSGYALMAVTLAGLTSSALPTLLYFLLGYALANLCAFAVVAHLRGRTQRTDYAGLATPCPWTATALVIALLSLTGIPPLAGFVGKLMLFGSTIEGGYAWLAVVAVANTVISLFYYLRFIAPVYFSGPSGAVATLDRFSGFTVGVTALGVLLAGLAAGWILVAMPAGDLSPG